MGLLRLYESTVISFTFFGLFETDPIYKRCLELEKAIEKLYRIFKSILKDIYGVRFGI